VSTYTYDPVHGGILTATSPAVIVNGAGAAIAPVKRYAYVQRYAWVGNGVGGYVHGGAQMWLLASEKICRSTATNLSTDSCAGGANDEIVTAYDYGPDSGPNNLLLRGTTVTAVTPNTSGTLASTTLRSCYGYDAQGNKISETKPRANLSVCP
jgi:YD repeat-containing protein